MAVTNVGPEREQYDLAPEEADAFVLIIEYNTKPPERIQLSYALKGIYAPKGNGVIDGFHKNARKMWRTVGPS